MSKDITPAELEQIERELEEDFSDMDSIPGLHGKTFAQLGLQDAKIGTLTPENTLTRMVFLSYIDSPFITTGAEGGEVTGPETAEAAYILFWGAAQMDYLFRLQVSLTMHPDDTAAHVDYRAKFRQEASVWFEGIIASEEDFKDWVNTMRDMLRAVHDVREMSEKESKDYKVNGKKKTQDIA